MNREIRAPEVRVISEDGKMLGVFHPMEAVRMAEERGLDLIEIAPLASPPTCKIMDFGKWKYENKKKAASAKKKQVVVNIKEIQLRPRTDQHDVEVKLRHARRFLLDGDKVKLNLRFLGRELVYQDMGFEIIAKICTALGDIGIVEVPAKKEGKQMFAIIAPDYAKIKTYKETSKYQQEKSAQPPPPMEDQDDDHDEDEESDDNE